MKIQKYKCIKSYPGGPSIGMTIEPVKAAWQGLSYWINNNYFNPENYQEFWELVVEKDYEILEFIHNGSNGVERSYVINMKYGKLDSLYQFLPESHYLNSSCWKINSVKRLSDGEIFTIGDMIDYPSIPNTKIESFTISDNNIVVWGKFISSMNGFVLLNGVSKSKKPIFTTEDGVEIFDGDKMMYLAHRKSHSSHTNYAKVILSFMDDYFVFSSDNKRSEWIEENKPQYSKKDLLYFVHEGRHYHSSVATTEVISEIIRLKK